MPKSLVIPGVSISTQFDVAPPLPARSGILGAVGVTQRIPSDAVQGVTTRQELLELYGPGTLYSFPEVFRALANGISEVVVSPVDPRSGQFSSATLLDSEGEAVVELKARAVGPWGDRLSVNVVRRLATDQTVRNVRLEVLLDGVNVETHDGLIMREGDDQDFFTAINRDSNVLVAIDPVFETDLPVRDTAVVAFADSGAQAARGALRLGTAALVQVSAPPGRAGNQVSLAVADGRASLTLSDPGSAPSLTIRARATGAAGATMSVRVTANATAGVDVTVVGLGGISRSYPNLTGVNALVTALASDPDLTAERVGALLPAPTSAAVNLAETRTVTLRIESVRTTAFPDLASANAIVAALGNDGAIAATLASGADGASLPDAGAANEFFLTGGRDAGLARGYRGQNDPDADVLELVSAPSSDAAKTRFQILSGTLPSTVRIVAGLDRGGAFDQREAFDNLVMDPESDTYLIGVLRAQSAFLRGIDKYLRSRATQFPAETPGGLPLSGGAAPTIAAFQDAIDALALEDDVDLALAGLQDWRDATLDGVAVQQALLGHARDQADKAHPRIVIGSIRPSENTDLPAIIDHAGQVTDRRFVLVAPAGADGAVAGLLGSLDFFGSPTFKTVAGPGVPLVRYSDAALDKLVGPQGNLCVVTERRGRGTIVVKGIATDGFQISVTRVADHCVREVKAIADKFIGELNSADSRNALKQMIIADFTQLERDGALVPSVDGKSPAFLVDVFASEEDTAGGIVRIDIAVRPVRAIDYIYATIRIKN